jgi:HlyD family secretion protein
MRFLIALTLASVFLRAAGFGQGAPADAIEVRGELQPAAQTEVKSKVAARIRKVNVTLGQRVKAGDVIAEIEDQSEAKALPEMNIVAPSSGTILSLSVKEGQSVIAPDGVNRGTTLVTIGDLSQLIVQAHVKDSDARKIAPRQPAAVTSDAIPDKSIHTTISFIAPVATVQQSVKGYVVQAMIENPDSTLRPGMTVRLTIKKIEK